MGVDLGGSGSITKLYHRDAGHGVGNRQCRVAVVGSRHGSGSRNGIALNGSVSRNTYQNRIGIILNGNGLRSSSCVAAVVGDTPGANDGTTTLYYRVAGHAVGTPQCPVTALGRPHGSGSRNGIALN